MHDIHKQHFSITHIGTLLLFSVILIAVSSTVTYTFLYSHQTQEIYKQTPIASQQITSTINTESKECGGLPGNLPEFQCPAGYRCKLGKLKDNLPDASGKCILIQN